MSPANSDDSLQRPTRPTLSRDFIIRTALAHIDRDGADALSMRKLAAAIGVDPMSLYYYVPNKAALFDGIVEQLWSEAKLPKDDATEPWTEQAADAMRAFRRTLLTHPNAVSIVATRPIVTPGALTLLDRWLGLITTGGVDPIAALDLVNCLAAYTIGHVLAQVGEPVGGEGGSPEDVYKTLTPETHPNLVAAFMNGYDYHPDESFDLGLRAMLAGWTR